MCVPIKDRLADLHQRHGIPVRVWVPSCPSQPRFNLLCPHDTWWWCTRSVGGGDVGGGGGVGVGVGGGGGGGVVVCARARACVCVCGGTSFP